MFRLRAPTLEQKDRFEGEAFDTGVCHMANFADPDGNRLTLHNRLLPYGTSMIDVERVDYIRVPVTDMDEANRFYGEVLGLERNPNSPDEDWVEYEVGNVTLAVMTPHTHDYEFTPAAALATIALRVPDVAGEGEARGRGRRGRRGVGLGRLPRRGSQRSGRQPHPAPPPVRAVPRRDDAVMQVERVDFVSFLTQDLPRAKRFYTEVLGLEIETEGESDMELRCGQVTLDIFDPSSIGQPFAPSPAGLALRVPDVDAARAELEAKGVEFDGETIETSVCRRRGSGSRRQLADAPPAVHSDEGRAGRLRLGADA